jgi:hypothetical protein
VEIFKCRGIILYLEYQAFSPVVRLAPPPTLLLGECVPPQEPEGGGVQHSLAGEGAGKPIRTTGEKAWHSVYSNIVTNRSWFKVEKIHQTSMSENEKRKSAKLVIDHESNIKCSIYVSVGTFF